MIKTHRHFRRQCRQSWCWLLLTGLQGLEHSDLRAALATFVVESDGQGKQLGVGLVGPDRAENASVFLGKRRSRRGFELHIFLRGGGAGPSRRETGRTLLRGHFAAFVW